MALGALFAVGFLIATSVAPQLFPATSSTEKWTSSFLNFGTNPVSHTLEVNFARVGYIDQIPQWNSSGFIGGTLTGNGSFLANSSGYGVMQFNSTANENGVVNYPVAGALGANVSYLFTNHRVALNGTTAVWYEEISEIAQTSSPVTSGNVSAASGGQGQNVVYLKATYSAGNYTFAADDFEWKHGAYDTFTSTAFAGTVKVLPLHFFNVYFYLQKTAATLSIVNTANASVLGSVTIHPLLDANLTKVAALTDVVTMPSGATAAQILGDYYLVDHNTYAGTPAATGAPAVVPFSVGAASYTPAAPFDPSANTNVYYNVSASPSSSGGVNSSLSDFAVVTNSSSAGSETSSLVNTSYVINGTSTASEATSKQAVQTLRAIGEPTYVKGKGTLYITTWTPSAIAAQINGYLQAYVSSKTGLAANQIHITGYMVQNVTVLTTYSSTAQQTVSNYLADALPSMLAANHLGLVNTQTGAIDAGADLGEFFDMATKQVEAPVMVNTGLVPEIYDPVNGRTYVTPQAAGFPIGSTLQSSGAIFVPGQGTFLGFGANGLPQFEGSSCFIICTSALTGAASSVSSFLGSAASSVGNAIGTVTNTVSNDVIQPVSGTLSSDLGGVASSLGQAIQQITPIAGAATSTLAGSVSSGLGSIGQTLGTVAGSFGSTASSVAIGLAAGVTSFSNNVYHLGGSIGSLVQGGANSIVNTLGATVGTASAVLSPYFAEAGNAIVGTVKGGAQALSSLGSSIAAAGKSVFNTVGSAIAKGAAGAWSSVSNAFGALIQPFLNGATGAVVSNGTGTMSWLDSLGGGLSTLTIIIIVIVVALILIVGVFLLLSHRRKRHSGHERGEGRRSRSRSGGRRTHRAATASVVSVFECNDRSAVPV
ncbi:MAG: hypothetical protein L3K07_03880 [Thermoplasmata archaeon]|nr:hypothetical protein [Thermoplasmata archaeon]